MQQVPQIAGMSGTYRGPEAVDRGLRELLDAFEEVGFEPDELIEAGDQIVAFVRVWARGRESGVEIDNQIAHVWTMRDGKAIRLVIYEDRAKALEAVAGSSGSWKSSRCTARPKVP